MAENVNLKNTPRSFDLHELFFSTTDEKGYITGCNDVFLRVADYQPRDILHKPHNAVRHPDMPRCVFKLLWDYLLSGRTIGAYVKNLAATGEYYWVYALACPIKGGFLSIRFKPSSPIFAVVQSVYEELLAIESSYPRKDRNDGMEASGRKLLETISGLGFQSYDAFMHESLRLEIETIAPVLMNHNSNNRRTKPGVSINEQLRGLKSLQTNLLDKAADLRAFIKTLHNLSANASVRARHVGNQGQALGIIGEEISRATRNLKSEIGGFEKLVSELSSALRDAAFKMSMAFLQGEMADIFEGEERKSTLSIEDQVNRYGQPYANLSKILKVCQRSSKESAQSTIANLGNALAQFNNFVDFLDKLIQTLQFGYVTGQAEVAGIADDKGFSLLLTDLNISSEKARTQLYELRSSVRAVAEATSTNGEVAR